MSWEAWEDAAVAYMGFCHETIYGVVTAADKTDRALICPTEPVAD